MSKAIAEMAPLVAESLQIATSGSTVRFTGVISMRNPFEIVTPHLRKIHSAILDSGLKAVTVDLTELRFMNSSSIRALVDWIEWIRREPDAKKYVLNFLPKRDASWQSTMLTALQSFGGDGVVVSSGA